MKLAQASKFQNVLVAQQCMLNFFVIRYQIGPIYTGKQGVLDAPCMASVNTTPANLLVITSNSQTDFSFTEIAYIYCSL
jgi:hypothetical protein